MESQDRIITEMDAVIYNVINSEPIIFKGINNLMVIMSLMINKNPLRMKNAIFEIEGGNVYCNSNDQVYNIVIQKEMFETVVRILLEGERKLKETVLNIYYQGAKWVYMSCDNSKEIKSLDERFSHATPFIPDYFTNLETSKLNEVIEHSLYAMINNEALNKITITSGQTIINSCAEYSKESNTFTYYHNLRSYNVTPMMLGFKLMEKEIKKIIICFYTFNLIGTKC